MLSQVMMNLVLVLSLALIALLAAKKWKHGGKIGGAHIKTLSILSLGTKEKILLLEVEGERLLVGVTASQMSTLKTFSSVDTELNSTAFAEVYHHKADRMSEAV